MKAGTNTGGGVEQELVTVVIPAYNAEKTLSRSMDSVLAQSHPYLDVIVVDDGSTDTTRALAEQHALKDPRVRVLHQENRGLSEARNTGIRAAQGTWITFLDADDWVEKDYLDTPLRLAEETAASVVLFGYAVDFEDAHGTISRSLPVLPGRSGRVVTEASGELASVTFLGMLGYAWNKLYRLPVERDGFLFEPGLALVEDMEFQSRIMPDAEEITLCPAALVHYVQPLHATTLGRRYSPRNFDLRLRWMACARSLITRWGLMDPAVEAALASLGVMIVYEAQRQAWSSTGPWPRRLARALEHLCRVETGTLSRRAVTTRRVPLRQRMMGALLWLAAAVCRTAAPIGSGSTLFVAGGRDHG